MSRSLLPYQLQVLGFSSSDYELREDKPDGTGANVYIAVWKSALPQPTQAELDAATEQAQKLAYRPEVENFCNALLGTAVGQRLVTEPNHSSLMGSLSAALACSNIAAVKILIPLISAEYNLTADEKTVINNLIDLYHMPINHL